MAAEQPGMINNEEFQIHVTHIPTGKKVDFKGWVTGFADNFQSQWTGTPVYGRMDDLYTFQKTSRRISIAFDVLAADAGEAMTNQTKLNKLTQFLYPVYSDPVAKTPGSPARNSQVLQAAPLLKLRWNGLAQDVSGGGLVGFLAGFIYQPVIDSGQFFVNKVSARDIVYQQHSVQLEFTVLHTHLTGWTKDGDTLTFGGKPTTQQNYPHAAVDQASIARRGKEISDALLDQLDIRTIYELREAHGDDYLDQLGTEIAEQGAAMGVTEYKIDPKKSPFVTIPPEIVKAAQEEMGE